MKVKTETREGLFKALTVEIQGDTVKKTLNEIYENLQKNVEIQGFRKGTAPLWLIKARYKNYIKEEAGKKIADQTLKSAIEESKLEPVADIFLESVNLEENKNKITYTVTFETPPEFELENVENLEVEIPKLEFNKEMLNRKIESLREEHAIWEPSEENPISRGDLVSIEYEVQEVASEGEKVSGETSGIIGQNMFREELEKEMLGKKTGEEVYIENLPLYNQEGKEIGKANIKVKIKEIKKKKLPETNDEFAKELGYENWKEAEKEIEKQVKEELKTLKEELIKRNVGEKLVNIHKIEVPKTLLNREISLMIENRIKELQQFGLDTRYIDYKALGQEFFPIALVSIKLRFILDKYAQEKGIEVTEKDVEDKINQLAKEMNLSPEEMEKRIKSNNLIPQIKEDIKREKALLDIISKVKIKEIEKEEKNEENK